MNFLLPPDFFSERSFICSARLLQFSQTYRIPCRKLPDVCLILEHGLNQSVIRVIFYKSVTCEKSLEKELRFLAPIVFLPKSSFGRSFGLPEILPVPIKPSFEHKIRESDDTHQFRNHRKKNFLRFIPETFMKNFKNL